MNPEIISIIVYHFQSKKNDKTLLILSSQMQICSTKKLSEQVWRTVMGIFHSCLTINRSIKKIINKIINENNC